MFKNPKKIRKFSEGTFIPTTARLLAIIQLCLAFSCFLWLVTAPFTEQTLRLKKQASLYDSVSGKNHPSRLKEYQKLSAEKKEALEQLNRSLLNLPREGIQIRPLEALWMVLAVVISIMLMKKVPSALEAVWLLPLIAGCYALDNYTFGQSSYIAQENLLFPQESSILKEPLASSFEEQKKQLMEAWKSFLITHWAPVHEISIDSEDLLQRAIYAFNVARFEAFCKDVVAIRNHPKTLFRPISMIFFLLWNTSFAWLVFSCIRTHSNSLSPVI